MQKLMLLSFLLNAFLFGNTFSQQSGEWGQIYQMPRGNSLYDVCATSEDTVIAVGEFGEIMNTYNGGQVWNHQNSTTSSNLLACDAVSNKVWAVGESGTILFSNDWGNSWTYQISNTNNDLTGVSFVNEAIGWAVGNTGKILNTTDSGNTWILQNSNTPENMNSVIFVDEQNGWCVGENGKILHTSNGGTNWNPQISNITENLTDVSFVNMNVGYISVPNGYQHVLKTINGGLNWFATTNPTIGYNAISIQFINEDNGWVLAEGYINHTTDGGNTWAWNGIYYYNVNSIYFLNGNEGWAVGGNYGTLIAVTNNGSTWNYQVKESIVPLNDIWFIDEYEGWAVGGQIHGFGKTSPDVILHTINGGFDWDPVIFQIGTGIYALQFINSSTGWAVSTNKVYRTTDGGMTWQYSAVGSGLVSVYFINPSVGWVAGGYKQLYKSTDGGVSWTPVDLSSIGNTYFQSVVFLDENNGWVSGYGLPYPFTTKIIHTTNGGNTWEVQYDTTGRRTWLHFENLLKGWAVNLEGQILNTTNGGAQWLEQYNNASQGFYDVQFINEQIGWVVGKSGIILKTTNGGTDWLPENSNSSNYLFDVFALNDSSVWVAGHLGQILKSQLGMYINDFPDAPTTDFSLKQNYPNPFNPTTHIRFSLPKASNVKIEVYNMLGQRVAELLNEQKQMGYHTLKFDGSNLSSGIYFYKIQSGSFMQVRKMLLVK